MAARVAVPQLDVLRKMRLGIKVDDSRTRIEEEQHIAWILADLVTVPHERLGWTCGRAPCERLDIFGPRRVVQTRTELLLSGSRPGLVRDLAVRWITHPARSAIGLAPLPRPSPQRTIVASLRRVKLLWLPIVLDQWPCTSG